MKTGTLGYILGNRSRYFIYCLDTYNRTFKRKTNYKSNGFKIGRDLKVLILAIVGQVESLFTNLRMQMQVTLAALNLSLNILYRVSKDSVAYSRLDPA